MRTVSASRVEPGHTDSVAFFDVMDVVADRGDDTDAFVSRDKWWTWFDWPISFNGMKVRVTDA
jgi:hypothetical protein